MGLCCVYNLLTLPLHLSFVCPNGFLDLTAYFLTSFINLSSGTLWMCSVNENFCWLPELCLFVDIVVPIPSCFLLKILNCLKYLTDYIWFDRHSTVRRHILEIPRYLNCLTFSKSSFIVTYWPSLFKARQVHIVFFLR